MVSSGDGPVETKKTQEYDLRLVQELLRKNSDEGYTITIAGNRVNGHLAKMGWTEDDIIVALLSLTEHHFDESVRYVTPKSWNDVYLLEHAGSNGSVYKLYIKIRLTLTQKMVVVCSFHPEGWE